MKGGAGEELAKAVGAIELSIDKELVAAAMVTMREARQKAFIACGSGFKLEDGGFEGETEAGADADGFGSDGGRHKVLAGS